MADSWPASHSADLAYLRQRVLDAVLQFSARNVTSCYQRPQHSDAQLAITEIIYRVGLLDLSTKQRLGLSFIRLS